MVKPFSYNRKEKLKSRKQLDELFTAGRSFSVFPIKVFYLNIKADTENPVKAGVGVSSRYFRKAVHRNRIKRLLRESYRLNKQPLYDFMSGREQQLAVFFLYVDKVLPEAGVLKKKMPLLLERLKKELQPAGIKNE